MLVVIRNEFRNKTIEMPLAECDEMVQSFVFNRLHKPFDAGIQIGRSDRQLLRLDAFIVQKLLEFGRILGVSIMDQTGRLLIPAGNVVSNAFACFVTQAESGLRVESMELILPCY